MSALISSGPMVGAPRSHKPAHDAAFAAHRTHGEPGPGQAPAPALRPASFRKWDILLFIAIYALVAGGFALLWLIARLGHPQAWQWGTRLMNAPLATAGLALLLLASAASAFALFRARTRSRWPRAAALAVAACGCLAFAATVLIDLDAKWRYGVRPGSDFRPSERYLARRYGVKLPKGAPKPSVPAPVVVPAVRQVDVAKGQKLFLGTCASCHGPQGEGLRGLGKTLVGSEFIAQRDDAALLDFVKVGRQPWDPMNTMKVQMPPRGGNPMLSDDDLKDIIAFVRTFPSAPAQAAASASAPAQVAASPSDQAGGPLAGAAGSAAPAAAPPPAPLLVPRWVVPEPPGGEPGLSREFFEAAARPAWKPPRDAVAFVDVYYLTAWISVVQAALVGGLLAALAVWALGARTTGLGRAPLAVTTVGCAATVALWLVVLPLMYAA
ncbi:MAG: cytochrome c [Phycisphaerae bacterium]|jgi:disulfide bond formation protein DsbB